MTGVLAGDVSGEASVEKGDILRRMDRSSEGREESGGALRLRPFPLRENRPELEEESCINSITSMSKVGSRSRMGLTRVSSSTFNWCSDCCSPIGGDCCAVSVTFTTGIFRLCDWLLSSSSFLTFSFSATGGQSFLIGVGEDRGRASVEDGEEEPGALMSWTPKEGQTEPGLS